MIPLFLLEQFLGPIPRVVPQFWANRGFENLLIRGLGLEAVMPQIVALLVFALAGLQCALGTSKIDRVVAAVEISPVPQAPAIVLGLVNVHGRILPVLNIRRLFRLPALAPAPEYQIRSG